MIALAMAGTPALAAGGPPTSMPAIQPEIRAKAAESLARGVKYLLAVQQKDGSWDARFPAITALAVKALVQAGQPVDSPAITKALAFIVAQQVKDDPKMKGSFSAKELANYNTAICLTTLVQVNAMLPGKPYEAQIRLALEFLRRDQWDENESLDRDNPAYGGFGYGGGQRPDMSNTTVALDALDALVQAGHIARDDPMFAKVQEFLTRAQNRSESNKVGTFTVGDDGGFIYTPALSATRGGAQSQAGEVRLPDGRAGLRSYGSMTYAGFKSYVYSGLPKDDPRVKAAFEWIRRNYTVAENPALGAKGLYYYYHTMARALLANGEPMIRDAVNVGHDWRAELVEKIASLQVRDGQEAGSWVNAADSKWEEGNPILATCFAMLAMEETVK